MSVSVMLKVLLSLSLFNQLFSSTQLEHKLMMVNSLNKKLLQKKGSLQKHQI